MSETKHIFSDKRPVVSKYENPKIRGVGVTATGAVNSETKNRLLKCVKALTGVSYDKIFQWVISLLQTHFTYSHTDNDTESYHKPCSSH